METADSLRHQIVTKALELFHAKGYHSTTLQDVVDAVGCSKGGFYHHFASKEDLLHLIHDTFITYELQRGIEVLNGPGTAAEKLRLMIIDLVESIALYTAQVTVFFEERRYLSSDKFQLIKQKRDEYEGVVRQVLVEGVRSGEFRADLDLDVILFSIFGMCNWTYQWMRPGGRLSPRQVGETMSLMVLQGITG